MRFRGRFAGATAVLLCALVGSATLTLAQRGPQRDPLGFLKRAITEANAPALTTQQETQLTDLINAFHQGRTHTPDQTLQNAHKAYATAILAGDQAAAQAAAATIASRTAELSSARLQAETKFRIDIVNLLKSGGQFGPLRQKLGDERLLGLISSLGGGPFGGRPGFGPGFGPGRGPGFAPGPRPGRMGGGHDNSNSSPF